MTETLSKIRISARINPFNWDMINDLAFTAFKDETSSEGNFSEALDFLLTNMRLNTQFTPLLRYFKYKALYERGDRSTKVIDAVKTFEAKQLMLLKIGISGNKN